MTASELRFWFVSDVHASNICFRKFLNLLDHAARPNVLMIGGDITGKQLVSIVDHGKGHFTVERRDSSTKVAAHRIQEIRKGLEDIGLYVYECDVNQFNCIRLSPMLHEKIFEQLARERLKDWVALADKRIAERDIKVIINAGNDDPLWVDEILDASTKLTRPEGKVLSLPAGVKLVSTGYSTMSPWKCPRDESEDALRDRIIAMIRTLKSDEVKRAIFSLHCPPRDTHLDLAPALDEALVKIAGFNGAALNHVGSSAVREILEEFQPLAALHGHIHTSAGFDWLGRTKCFNPGSAYASGTLQGVFLIVNEQGELAFDQLTSERVASPRDSAKPNWLETLLGLIFKPVREVHERLDSVSSAAREKGRREGGNGG